MDNSAKRSGLRPRPLQNGLVRRVAAERLGSAESPQRGIGLTLDL